ncbi:MAG: hypothetical protein CMN30_09925 [Sandaracinus sp.]|nr:hypothetical protein [Sandaracinus sp.]
MHRAASGRVAALAAALAFGTLAAPAAASDFWDEVREPGSRAYAEEVRQARRALRSRERTRAAQLARSAIERLPERPEARVVLGLALGPEDPATGAEELARALSTDPGALDDESDGADAADVLARGGRYELAADLMGRLLGRMRAGAARQNLYVLYGDVLGLRGPEHLDDAERAYREALRAVPHEPRASIGLALVLHRRGDDTDEWRRLAERVAARGRVESLLASLPLPDAERAARRALVLTAIGDRSGARSAWDLAREGAWTDHATRSSEALR